MARNNDNRLKVVWGVPDGYKFECQMCGKCCVSKGVHQYFNDDMLNAMGMKGRFAEGYEGMPTNLPLLTYPEAMTLQKRGFTEFFPVLVLWEGNQAIIHYSFKQYGDRCAYLKDNNCFLHEVGLKPLYCQLFPLGITYNKKERAISIYIVDVNCPGVGKGRPPNKTQVLKMFERFMRFSEYMIPRRQAEVEWAKYNLKIAGVLEG